MTDRIIAVNSNCYHGYSIEAALEGISEAGFRYVELTATKGWTEHVFPTMSFERLQQIKDKLEESKLIPFALSGHCNLMDEARIADFRSNMKLAAFFGCDYIVSSIGEAHLEDKATVSNQEVAEHVKVLLPHLEDLGLTLVLENHGDHGTGAILKDIVDRIGADNVLINYDTGNAIFYGDVDFEKDLDACLDKIGFLHIKDKGGARDAWDFPAIGNGYVDFPLIFRKLEQAQNNSPFSIEIEFTAAGPKDLQEINQALKMSYEYLTSLGLRI